MLAAMDNAKALGSGLSVLIEVVCSEFLLPNCQDCRETVRLNYLSFLQLYNLLFILLLFLPFPLILSLFFFSSLFLFLFFPVPIYFYPQMLKSTPPYTDSHIMCQEQALRLAKQQLSDLNDYRQKMNKETEETNEVRKFYPVIFLLQQPGNLLIFHIISGIVQQESL